MWDLTHWEGFPDAQTYRGLAGIEEVLQMLRDVFRELDVRPVQIREARRRPRLGQGPLRIRGRTSGAELDAPPFAQIIEFRDELIVRVENYSDVEAARRAAGLAGP